MHFQVHRVQQGMCGDICSESLQVDAETISPGTFKTISPGPYLSWTDHWQPRAHDIK
jgi:hypothetical protein